MKKLSSLLVLIFCLIPFVASAWILRDEFNTALSAGSVHNTTSEPSGHTRTVTDTENKLSIADGKLTFSGGKASPAWGDPAIWYPSVARAAGVSIILDITPTDATTSAEFGFDSGQSGNIVGNAMRITGDTIITYDGSTAGSSIFIPANATNYQLATILRSAGAYYFLKGGTATKWSMLWAGGADNTTPLYPGIANYDLASTNSFIRIPTTLWLPTPLASDGFGTAGVTDGLGHAEGVATGIGEGGGGLAWQSGGTTWSVSGGKAVNTPLVYGEELIVNGDMETGNPPSTWETTYAPVLTVEADRSGAGSQSLGATISSGHTWMQILQTFTTETGKYYKLSVYSKAQALISTKALLYRSDAFASLIGSDINKTGDWAMTTLTARALSENTGILFESDYTEPELGKMFLDDVSVKELKLSELFNTIQSSTPDVISTVTLPINPYGIQQGMILNLDSVSTPLNFVVAYYSYNRVYLDKCVNGTWTNIITEFVGYVENAELRVIKDGTTYRLYYNDTLIGTATISDESIINNTRHGLFSTDVRSTLDNFTLYARGTGNEYNILNQLMSTTSGGSLNLLGVGK
jgi:hypothetical protein